MNEILPPQQTSAAEAEIPAQPHYAGFWIRAAAFIIDCLIVSIPVTLLSLPLMGYAAFKITPVLEQISQQQGDELPPEFITAIFAFYGIILLINLIYGLLFLFYFACMESGQKQSTWGKRAMGLKVTDMEGSRISFWRGMGRTCSKILSYMTFYIGFMLAGWTAKKQALHDLIANTVVVYKER